MIKKTILKELYSVKQIRDMEQYLFNIHPSYSVMYYAGVFIFNYLLKRYNGRTFHIILGSGNNAGDGLIASLLLKKAKQEVYCYKIIDKPYEEDALKAYMFAKDGGVIFLDKELIPKDSSDTILIDAIFGIGFKGQLPPEVQKITKRLNEQVFFKCIAIDVASGLNPDTGQAAENTFIADKTLTFIGKKQGLYYLDGKRVSGKVYCFDLGAIKKKSKVYSYYYKFYNNKNLSNYNKSNFGHLLVIGGGKGMFGAAALSSISGLKVGVGKATLFTHKDYKNNYKLNNTYLYEVMRLDNIDRSDEYKTICLGPGLGRNDWAQKIFNKAIRSKNIVIDADGLFFLAKSDFKLTKEAVITPHEAEATRLLGVSTDDIRKNKIYTVKSLAIKYNCIVVLKGSGTLISDGSDVFINTSGNVYLATAGTGDVLAGIISGLFAKGHSALDAAMIGTYLHGRAADDYQKVHNGKTMRASDLFSYLKFD